MSFASDAVFGLLEEGVKADGANLVSKIKGIYGFKVTDGPGGATKEWTIDLKNGSGSVKPEKAKADVTLTLADATFVALANGKANAQQLFMQGKIKMQGNMGLAMKFDQVIKAKGPAAAAAPTAGTPAPAAAPSGAAGVFAEIKEGIAADPSLCKKINGVFSFALATDAGKKEYTVDLKNAPGSVSEGKPAKADVTLSVSEANFLALADGKANPQQLFMQGKIKLQGNMGLAMKLEQVIKAKRPVAKL